MRSFSVAMRVTSRASTRASDTGLSEGRDHWALNSPLPCQTGAGCAPRRLTSAHSTSALRGWHGPCPRNQTLSGATMTDDRNRDGAAEREELLDELEENHERARREAAGHPETVEKRDPEKTERDEKNPPRTSTGKVTSPKFGSAGSGGAEFEGPLPKN